MRPASLRSGAFAAIFVAALFSVSCDGASDEAVASLEPLEVVTGWYDDGIIQGGKNKLVPSVTMKLRNKGDKALKSVQINAIFRRVGEQEMWGEYFGWAVPRSEPLPAGAETQPCVRSTLGLPAISRASDEQNREFVDAKVDIYLKQGSQVSKLAVSDPRNAHEIVGRIFDTQVTLGRQALGNINRASDPANAPRRPARSTARDHRFQRHRRTILCAHVMAILGPNPCFLALWFAAGARVRRLDGRPELWALRRKRGEYVYLELRTRVANSSPFGHLLSRLRRAMAPILLLPIYLARFVPAWITRSVFTCRYPRPAEFSPPIVPSHRMAARR